MRSKRPPEFQLSDAPIHRIQTLVAALSHAMRLLPDFVRLKEDATFVRRDFDYDQSNGDVLTLFNATNCYNGCFGETSDQIKTPNFTSNEINDLVNAGINSLGFPREALERARIRLTSGEELIGIEKAHHLLEIYSRISYSGGLPGFYADHFTKTKEGKSINCPLISLVAIESEDGKNFFDRFEFPAKTENENHPDIVPLSERITEQFRKLQSHFEPDPGKKDAGNSSLKLRYAVIPVFEYLHSNTDENVQLREPHAFGSLLGLLLVPIPGGIFFDQATAQKLLHQLAPHLNSFAESFQNSEFDEILREDYRGDDPLQFLMRHLSRIDGWSLHEDSCELQQPLVIKADGIHFDLRPDLLSTVSPLHVCITPSGNDSWLRWCENTNGSYSYALRIARRLRHYFKETKLQQAERLTGRVEEQQAVFTAASHELKKLACLIKLANGHDHILDKLPNVFLMFSLPTAGRLNERDAPFLPPDLYGYEGQTLKDWILKLIRISAEIEAIAKPGKSGEIIKEAEAYEDACRMFTEKFEIDQKFGTEYFPPSDFAARCLFGTGLICLLRNILQHAYEDYDNVSENPWKECYKGNVVISLESNSIRFSNPTPTKSKNGNGGTNSAAISYFSQLSQIGWKFNMNEFSNGFEKGLFVCRVPLPTREQSK